MSSYKNNNVQHWHNQNHFLQVRHGHNKQTLPETILVGLSCSDDGYDVFQLLSWAISVSARPGDSVIALQLKHNGSKIENLIGKLQRKSPHEDLHVTESQLKALKQLCEVKQVKLDVRYALGGNEEVELVEETVSVLATMLVLGPLRRHSTRNVKKRIGLLARKLPNGCTIVVVKDCKVLLYMESNSKGTVSSYLEGSSYGSPVSKSKQNLPMLQRQFSCGSRNEDNGCSPSLDTKNTSGSRIWPVHMTESSPTGVLDSYASSPTSDISSPSTPRRRFLPFLFPQDGSVSKERMKRSSLLKSGSFQRSSTFPLNSRMKKYSGPLDYTSATSPFNFYSNSVKETGSNLHISSPQTCDVIHSWRCFTYVELAFATNHFSEENMVGKGGHSEVYRGKLLDGRSVAIKRLKKGGSEAIIEADFLAELGIIAHVAHPNATPLVGFCLEEGLHLIFDFSSNGSLASLLHGVTATVLEWSMRYKVAVGTARGLHYLHTGCPRRIIHRDIKASNILLGPDYEPQISDFGLAKWLPEQCVQLSVFPVEGTFGYLSPEYFMHGIINEKTDVFAFGVLLLELITGRQPIDESQRSLVIWAKPFLESSQLDHLADPRLEGQYDSREMNAMIVTANLCVQPSPISRPDMAQVLELLTNDNFTMPCTRSQYYDDLCEEYSPSNYLSDLSRHREIALQF